MRSLFFLVCLGCGSRTELLVDECPTCVAPATCGNGIVERGEACDLGADNSDTPAPFLVSQGGKSFSVTPVMRPTPAETFYSYIGASSFTGFEVEGESRVYLYLDTKSTMLSLIVNHNKFGVGAGSAQMIFQGLPRGFQISLSDDDGELLQNDATSARGIWSWNENTDGGVIAGLACPGTWTIQVFPDFLSGISSWNWVNADTTRTPLAMTDSITIESRPRCRTNCTIPDCGQ
jgi:hypothetical protein